MKTYYKELKLILVIVSIISITGCKKTEMSPSENLNSFTATLAQNSTSNGVVVGNTTFTTQTSVKNALDSVEKYLNINYRTTGLLDKLTEDVQEMSTTMNWDNTVTTSQISSQIPGGLTSGTSDYYEYRILAQDQLDLYEEFEDMINNLSDDIKAIVVTDASNSVNDNPQINLSQTNFKLDIYLRGRYDKLPPLCLFNDPLDLNGATEGFERRLNDELCSPLLEVANEANNFDNWFFLDNDNPRAQTLIDNERAFMGYDQGRESTSDGYEIDYMSLVYMDYASRITSRGRGTYIDIGSGRPNIIYEDRPNNKPVEYFCFAEDFATENPHGYPKYMAMMIVYQQFPSVVSESLYVKYIP
jgi:hypothetical protein